LPEPQVVDLRAELRDLLVAQAVTCAQLSRRLHPGRSRRRGQQVPPGAARVDAAEELEQPVEHARLAGLAALAVAAQPLELARGAHGVSGKIQKYVAAADSKVRRRRQWS